MDERNAILGDWRAPASSPPPDPTPPLPDLQTIAARLAREHRLAERKRRRFRLGGTLLLLIAFGVGATIAVPRIAKVPRPDTSELAWLSERIGSAADYLASLIPADESGQPSPPHGPVVAAPDLDEEFELRPDTRGQVPDFPVPPPFATMREGTGPHFAPNRVRPELRDTDEAVRIVERAYPRFLKEAGIGGQVLLSVVIDTTGLVRQAHVRESSGHPALDEAALEAATKLEFAPALDRDRKATVWIMLPITFSVK